MPDIADVLKRPYIVYLPFDIFPKKKVKGSMLYHPFDISSQKVKALSKNTFSLFKFLLLSSYLILFRGFSQPGLFAYLFIYLFNVNLKDSETW